MSYIALLLSLQPAQIRAALTTQTGGLSIPASVIAAMSDKTYREVIQAAEPTPTYTDDWGNEWEENTSDETPMWEGEHTVVDFKCPTRIGGAK